MPTRILWKSYKPLSFEVFLLQLKVELAGGNWAEARSFVNEASNYLLPHRNVAN